MKIVIEIPDFVPPQRAIFIMAGMHKIGYIEPHTRKVFVQTAGCSQCGLCCKSIDCPDLEKEPGANDMWRCSKNIMRPFLCCISDGKRVPECTIRYEEVV